MHGTISQGEEDSLTAPAACLQHTMAPGTGFFMPRVFQAARAAAARSGAGKQHSSSSNNPGGQEPQDSSKHHAADLSSTSSSAVGAGGSPVTLSSGPGPNQDRGGRLAHQQAQLARRSSSAAVSCSGISPAHSPPVPLPGLRALSSRSLQRRSPSYPAAAATSAAAAAAGAQQQQQQVALRSSLPGASFPGSRRVNRVASAGSSRSSMWTVGEQSCSDLTVLDRSHSLTCLPANSYNSNSLMGPQALSRPLAGSPGFLTSTSSTGSFEGFADHSTFAGASSNSLFGPQGGAYQQQSPFPSPTGTCSAPHPALCAASLSCCDLPVSSQQGSRMMVGSTLQPWSAPMAATLQDSGGMRGAAAVPDHLLTPDLAALQLQQRQQQQQQHQQGLISPDPWQQQQQQLMMLRPLSPGDEVSAELVTMTASLDETLAVLHQQLAAARAAAAAAGDLSSLQGHSQQQQQQVWPPSPPPPPPPPQHQRQFQLQPSAVQPIPSVSAGALHLATQLGSSPAGYELGLSSPFGASPVLSGSVLSGSLLQRTDSVVDVGACPAAFTSPGSFSAGSFVCAPLDGLGAGGGREQLAPWGGAANSSSNNLLLAGVAGSVGAGGQEGCGHEGVGALAAATAQHKLQQLSALEALQQQLRQDVANLLPLI